MTSGVARDQLRAFIERIERLEEEIRELNADKSDIYKEARGQGFDVKTMRKVVAARKLDTDERMEQDSLFDMYMHALGMAPDPDEAPRARAHARENIEEIPPAPERKPTGNARRNDGCEGANEGGDDVDRSASARPSGQDTVGTPPPGVDGGNSVESASGPDVKRASHSRSGGDEVGAVNAKGGLPDTDGVEPSPPVHRWSRLRPHCLNPDLCSGYGDKHCTTCRQAMQNAEVAA